MLRWLKRILLGLLALVFLAVAVIYIGSHLVINERHEAEERSLAFLDGGGDPVEGERLAKVYGCFEGCHGRDMQGRVFFEEDWVVRLIAPNITAAVRRWSPAEFEAAVRQGVRPDGRGLMMPSDAFSIMTDQEFADLYAFISAYPEQEDGFEGETEYRPLARLGLFMREFEPSPVNTESPWDASRLSSPDDHGLYLAKIACAECHGKELEGAFGPPLTIAKAYDREQFHTLMATGVGLDPHRNLGVMAEVARGRFAQFTDAEVDALYDYLMAR